MAAETSLDLDAKQQEEILALESRLKSANHFDLLGISPVSSIEEVRKAFHELSRKFHPDRFYGKNLGEFKPKLDVIFKRLVEASQTLIDPAKRAAYLAANPFVRAAVKLAQNQAAAADKAGPTRPKTDEEQARDAERRARLVRHPYLMKVNRVQEHVVKARAHMAKGEHGHAFTNLNLAVQMDPSNADVKALLAEVRKKNDAQRSDEDYKRGLSALELGNDDQALAAFRAAVNANEKHWQAAEKAAHILQRHRSDPKEILSFLQKAADGDPKNGGLRARLGEAYENAGMKALAKKQYDEAARLAPDDPVVKKHVKRRWPF